MPDPIPLNGLAMSALPPSAAMVNAARQTDFTSRGKRSKSFRAAFIQEIGRVCLVIDPSTALLGIVVIFDNTGQVS
jgi:hypothetical protein